MVVQATFRYLRRVLSVVAMRWHSCAVQYLCIRMINDILRKLRGISCVYAKGVTSLQCILTKENTKFTCCTQNKDLLRCHGCKRFMLFIHGAIVTFLCRRHVEVNLKNRS